MPAAVAAARRLGVALTLDAPPAYLNAAWLRDMARTGIDGFVVTTNIDLGVGGNHPLATAKPSARVVNCQPRSLAALARPMTPCPSSDDWDIAIVGRSIADAVAPADMAQQLTSIVRKIHTEECL
ncbi:hypothetical protein [Nocardia abscessus]|uniref:hypothetical protein n=2 Tax=Nocardia abscessus TaxID=120957 RepID=UPI0012F71838|nr:hypothetical protein [Nocardia abscessus]MCC3332909.1 hypothetical protein [Nocardia abscessus]